MTLTKSIVILLLVLSAIGITPLVHSETALADIIFKGPVFQYTLREDHDPVVCKHMLRVFNDKFSHPWDSLELTDSAYSADSKYAFPRLSGVQHSAQITFDMQFSAQPTSPEFSAIRWNEGRVIPGGCPEGKTCSAASRPEPVLVAYFDFDNDGSKDTVVKIGSSFFPGYARMSWAQEFLIVWRGQQLEITNTSNLWDLEHPADKRLRPIIKWGYVYVRPFIYRGITYIASYAPSFRDDSGQNLNRYMPPYPIREDIFIEKYSFTGQMETTTGRPQWTTNTICDLGMKRLKD
jgi:hypothetical protein